jgi:hypothetical protein
MSNAYQNASLLVTPNGYEAGTIFSAKPTDGSGDLSFSRASTALRRNSSGLWESVANNVPRLQYPVGGGCPSWLFEPQATNIALGSQLLDLVTYWLINPSGTYTDEGISPLFAASTDVHSWLFTAAAQRPFIYQDISMVNTSLYTFSFNCESVSGSLTYDDCVAVFSSGTAISNIVIKNNGVTKSGTDAVAAGFIEYSFTCNHTGSHQFRLGVGVPDVRTGTIKLSQPQVESGSVATSPIITAGSAVTRLADVQGDVPNLGLTDFTYYMEFTVPKNTVGIHSFYNAANSRIFYLAVNSSNFLSINSVLGGGSNIVALLNTIGTKNKIAIRLSGGFIKPVVNGIVLASIATTAADLKTYGQLNTFGFNDQYSNYAEIVYPAALSDSEAIDLTTL